MAESIMLLLCISFHIITSNNGSSHVHAISSFFPLSIDWHLISLRGIISWIFFIVRLPGGSAAPESFFNYLSIPSRWRIRCLLLKFYFVRLHEILFKQSRFFWTAIWSGVIFLSWLQWVWWCAAVYRMVLLEARVEFQICEKGSWLHIFLWPTVSEPASF